MNTDHLLLVSYTENCQEYEGQGQGQRSPETSSKLIKFFSAHQVRKRESMHASGLALKEYQ